MFLKKAVVVFLLGFMTSCATVDPDYASPKDPWESFNRSMFVVNDTLDSYILLPLAVTYRYLVPSFMRQGVSNFFSTLRAIPNAFNYVLQGKPQLAFSESGRLVLNSTLGVLGLFDAASWFDISAHDTGLGDTLAVWGVPAGPYLVLPIIQAGGSVRDTFGSTVQNGIILWGHFSQPYLNLGVKWSLFSLAVLEYRESRIGISDIADDLMFDKYTMVRELHLQK